MAVVTGYGQSASAYLSYNAASVTYNSIVYSGNKSNQIILSGNGRKRLDGIQASWIPIGNGVDPATLRSGRILVCEGDVGKGSDGAYQDIFIDPQLIEFTILGLVPGIRKILLDVPTVGASHRIITLGDLGIMLEQDLTLSIIQTPMYISGNSDLQPGPTLAHLSCQVSEIFTDRDSADFNFKLR